MLLAKKEKENKMPGLRISYHYIPLLFKWQMTYKERRMDPHP